MEIELRNERFSDYPEISKFYFHTDFSFHSFFTKIQNASYKIDFIVYNDRNLYSNLRFVRLIYQIQISNETNVEIGGANPIRCNDAESICPNR